MGVVQQQKGGVKSGRAGESLEKSGVISEAISHGATFLLTVTYIINLSVIFVKG